MVYTLIFFKWFKLFVESVFEAKNLCLIWGRPFNDLVIWKESNSCLKLLSLQKSSPNALYLYLHCNVMYKSDLHV